MSKCERVFTTTEGTSLVVSRQYGHLAAGSMWSFDIIVLENPGDIGSYDIAVLGSLG